MDLISPSLLENVPKRSKECHERFRLGMGEWTESSDESSAESEAPKSKPPKKKLKLSVPKDKENRWQFVDDAKEAALSKKFVPKNTATSTKWAVSNFVAWRDGRNARYCNKPEKQVPMDLLEKADTAVLGKWLSLYVAETRKQDGGRYPPKSVYMLLTGLLRHMRTLSPLCPNFLDTANQHFSSFHNALDNVFRELRSDGVGSETKEAQAFSKEEGESLWGTGVLSIENPKGLLRAVFFLNGKKFCLRGGEEHRQLKLSQLKKFTDPLRYVYTENSSKNHSGGLAQIRVKHKVVPIVAVPDAGTRCHVYVLDLYMQKLPPEAFSRDNFYVQPCLTVPDDPSKPWFTSNPVGKNTLSKMVKEMCSESGVNGEKTNHSLRATGISDLYQAGVPEKVIQERSGHLSISGLRQYERTTLGQQQAVSRILSSREGTTFQKQLSLQTTSRVIPAQPPPVPQMNFSSCTVTIYNGPSVLPALPQPYSAPPPLAIPSSSELDLTDIDFDEFMAD